MIDNFDKILELLEFKDSGDFYFTQIIKRKKDNPEIVQSERVIKSYYFYSKDEILLRKGEIIKLCDDENARAYINLNRRNDERIALEMLRELATRISQHNYRVLNLYDSCCGKYSSETSKRWFIDFDSKDTEVLEEVCKIITEVGGEGTVLGKLPTKNGYHIVTRGFNSEKLLSLQTLIKKDDIKKNNSTILYL